MSWLSGWAYRRAVTITEQSGSTLTDYQVRIELNSSNFDFSKANSDGSDIRFTEDDGETLLPYWIEKWDDVNEEATIWVKVSSIPANGETTIYLYYGNSGAESESDGEAVFEFFDDFNDLSKWGIVRVGGSGFAKAEGGYLKLYSTDGFTTVDTEISLYNHIIESKVHAVSTTYPLVIAGTQGQYGTSGFLTNGYYTALNADVTIEHRHKISKRVNEASTDLVTTTQNLLQDGQTYIIGFVFSTPDLKLILDGNTLLETTDSTFTQLPHLAISVYSGGEYWIEWIRVRKYAEQEPTASVGSETSPTISGIVKLSNGTPVQGATVISIREDTYEIVDVTTSESDGSYTLAAAGGVNNTVIVIPSAEDQNGDIKCHIQPT